MRGNERLAEYFRLFRAKYKYISYTNIFNFILAIFLIGGGINRNVASH
jgi:hypothetical protein